MISNKELLHNIAKKYAQAFINVYSDTLTFQDYLFLSEAGVSLKRNKRLVFFWNLSAIDPVVKAMSVEQICKKYHLNEMLKKLCYFLLEQDRLSLIPLVFGYIATLYRQITNRDRFTIISSQALSNAHKNIIQHFLESKTKKSIMYTYKIDPSLIAGLRLESDSLLWEHSIRKQLKSLELLLAG